MSKRKLNGLPLTAEQDIIVTTAQLGLNIVIGAFAGTGKTSTLEAITRYHPENAIYIAFNSAIAKEARQRFPEHVQCMTANSLAFRAIISGSRSMQAKFENASKGKRLNNSEIIEALNLSGTNTINPNTKQLVVAITHTLNNFLQSADLGITLEHVSPKVATWSSDDLRRTQIAKGVRDYAIQLWKAMSDPRNPMGITHDGYLKVFQLSNPRINTNLLLLDEAQDSNPVLLDIISKQKCQKIFVGDKHQSIYAWRGAVDAMDKLLGERLYLTQSFRFGANIAKLANACLKWKDEVKQVVGMGHPKAVDHPQDVWLCRTNMSIFSKAVEAINNHKKVHIVGGIEDVARMIEGAYFLKKNEPWKCKSPELSEFNSWDEMIEYAQESEDIDINRLIKFIDRHKEKTMVEVNTLRKTTDITEDHADVVLSTAHKSKGREWPYVKMADDFKLPTDTDDNGEVIPFYPEDMNLLYVAVTRAKNDVKLTPNQFDFLVKGKMPPETNFDACVGFH